MLIKYLSKSSAQTKKLGEILAKEILKTKPRKKALVLALVGDLGAGKTTFIKAFLRSFGVSRRITSTTFLIMRKYPLGVKSLKTKANSFKGLYHIDAYRLNNEKGLLALGIKEILEDSSNIVLIEWADKVKKILPEDAIWIKLRHGESEHERVIEIAF